MTFKTIFVASNTGFGETWVGLVFIAMETFLIFILYRSRRFPREFIQSARLTVFWCLLILTLSITVGGFTLKLLHKRLVRLDLQSRHLSIVQGSVSDFYPMPHAEQSFVVQGRRFSCPNTLEASKFQNGAFFGSPLHNRLQVRITYLDKTILRLEVAQ